MTGTTHILSTSDEIAMLRESARSMLLQEWPPERAVAASKDPSAMRRIWDLMSRQGWLALGSDPDDAGLRLATVLLNELGRAACPVPLADAFLANTLLAKAASAPAEASNLWAALHQGKTSLSLVLGSHDGDANAGALGVSTRAGKTVLSGQAAFVEGTSTATHLLVMTDQSGKAAIVDARIPQVTVSTTPGFIAPPLAEVSFDAAPATVFQTGMSDTADLSRLARHCLTARAFGAASRGFEMVVDYAKLRTQFGKKIGQFQAIQHKLANVMINMEISRLTLWRAAASHDRGDPDWRYAAGAAVSVASPALRQACLETHHAFGGGSFWEEHEMPRHFRRIHADLVRCGGIHAAREDMAHFLLDARVE